jgi:hypothetical protein
MLINFPFIPETDETVALWKTRIKKRNLSEKDLESVNFSKDKYIAPNLTKDDTGLDDNTGLYHPVFNIHHNSVSLEDGFVIESFPEFTPVTVTERRIDQDADEDDVYSEQSDRLWKTYGYVLSINDFMELIGKQLQKSKRKFAVAFALRKIHDNIFHKNGRLHHPNHENVNLIDDEDIISFHIYELLHKENDFILNHDNEWGFMCYLNRLDTEQDTFNATENYRDKSVMSKLDFNINKD